MTAKRREERTKRERRITDLATHVMVAIAQRDAAVAEAEKRARVEYFDAQRLQHAGSTVGACAPIDAKNYCAGAVGTVARSMSRSRRPSAVA